MSASWLVAAAAVGAFLWLGVPAPDRARGRLRPAVSDATADGGPRIALPTRLAAGVGAGTVAAWLASGLGAAPGVAVGGLVAVAVIVALGRLEPAALARERHRIVLELPVALDLLASCLAAGLPLRRALPKVTALLPGPLGRELGRVTARLELGEGDAAAWRALVDHDQLGRLARDAARSAESGAPLAELFGQHAHDARADRRAALEERARTAGVRAVLPVALCFLPAFFLIGVVPIVAGAVMMLLPA